MTESWAVHSASWRDPAQIAAQWQAAADTDPQLLRCVARGGWWDTLAECGVTLLVSREYEHLVMAMRVDGEPQISFLRLPHPSGIAVDRTRGIVRIASTRNPNQVFDLAPAADLLARDDVKSHPLTDRPLLPVGSRFYPGCLYLHDIALIAGRLHGNAVGQNAIVRLEKRGRAERVWWPRCIEAGAEPNFGQNHLQLNSIAAGDDLAGSYFSASTDTLSRRRPGHRDFPVDRRGVIFSGATREPIARGLTRPHSARLAGGRLWVDNSGYGELGTIESGRFEPVARLPGWTRGLCFVAGVAFVGTSRVIPRFRGYAPGLDVDTSMCGVHAVEAASGQVLGSLEWPAGNEIFALDWVPSSVASGLPFAAQGRRSAARERDLFYAFSTATPGETA